MTCTLVSGTSSVTNNDHTTNTQGGNCKSKNIVYAATCQLCQKNNVYVGKSVCTLSQRVNGYRSKFYDLCETFNGDEHFSVLGPGDVNDDYVLGNHLFYVHTKRDKSDFNNCFLFDILCTTSPENIRKLEQFF